MYQVDSDLSKYFGEGKGFAKSIDLSTFQNAQQLAQQKQARKEAEQEKNLNAIYKQIDAIPNALDPNDQVYIGNKQKELADFVYTNLDRIKENDPSFYGEFLQKKKQTMTEATQVNDYKRNEMKLSAYIKGKGGIGNFFEETIPKTVLDPSLRGGGEIPNMNRQPIMKPKKPNAVAMQEMASRLKATADDPTGRYKEVTERDAEKEIENYFSNDTNALYAEARLLDPEVEGHYTEDKLNTFEVPYQYDERGRGTKKLKLTLDPEKLKEADENGNPLYIAATPELLAKAKYMGTVASVSAKAVPVMTPYQQELVKKNKGVAEVSDDGTIRTKNFDLVPFTEIETETKYEGYSPESKGGKVSINKRKKSFRIVSSPEAENKKVDIIQGGRAYEVKPLIVDRYEDGTLVLRGSVDGRVMEFPIDPNLRANLKGHISLDPHDATDIMYGKINTKRVKEPNPSGEPTRKKFNPNTGKIE